jgi:arylsulfatase A-like enzyme
MSFFKRSAHLLLAALALSSHAAFAQQQPVKKPNIIFILSDDLSWGDTGPFGQKEIKTPNIDRIAREGVKFTQAYAGNSVCAPSRSCLMQGKHPGHARVRDNSYKNYRESLQPGDYTVAALLQKAGYKTGLFGKWGLSNHDQPGVPNDMGFDEFFGYLNQQQAHNFYPQFLYNNKERVYYPENGEHHILANYSQPNPYDANGKVKPIGVPDPAKAKYAFDEYAARGHDFVRRNKDQPFFLYLAYTIPHGQIIVPDLGIYKDKNWPQQYKEWAAMITRMDTEIGKLLDLLKELNLDDNTLIFFAGDNGNPSGYDKAYPKDASTLTISQFFKTISPTRGQKGDGYDGAFHVPAIARWPKHIQPGTQSDLPWAFWDFMPTAAEVAGVAAPKDIDGVSILPTLLGKSTQKKREFLYWEYEQNQAVRYGKWFGHRKNGGVIELYDLPADPAQSRDLSAQFPEVTKRIKEIMISQHTPSTVWPSPGESEAAFTKRLKDQHIPARENNISNY